MADGETGLLFEMGDVEELAEPMMLLADNSSKRTVPGRAARKSWRASIPQKTMSGAT